MTWGVWVAGIVAGVLFIIIIAVTLQNAMRMANR